MSLQYGFVCTIEDIDGPHDEPDWTIYADCQDCGWFYRGECGEDDEAVRWRVDEHIRSTGHTVKWTDAEQEFYGREPVLVGKVGAS